jgi:acylphosphatase
MSNPLTMMRMTAIVKGRVQGVGYRYFVTDCAAETGVSGFVRNEPDGAVLVVAEGKGDTLEKFIRMIQAERDPVIRVDSLEITESKPTGEFRGFGIRW